MPRTKSKPVVVAKKGNKTLMTAYERAASRVIAILDDPDTPPFLRDVLEDAISTLRNETEAGAYHPEIARIELEIGLRDAYRQRLRQHNGRLSHGGEEADDAAN